MHLFSEKDATCVLKLCSAHLENQSSRRHPCLQPGSQLLLLRLTRGQLARYWALRLGCTCGWERWKLSRSKERCIGLSNSPCTILHHHHHHSHFISSFLPIFTELSQEQRIPKMNILAWQDNPFFFLAWCAVRVEWWRLLPPTIWVGRMTGTIIPRSLCLRNAALSFTGICYSSLPWISAHLIYLFLLTSGKDLSKNGEN